MNPSSTIRGWRSTVAGLSIFDFGITAVWAGFGNGVGTTFTGSEFFTQLILY